MELQQIFDTVSTHLLTQNRKASNKGGDCFFRTKDGATCAVGCLIPEAAYYPEMEGLHLSELLRDGLLPVGEDNREQKFDLLRSLQHIHYCSAPDVWAHRLDAYAQKHDLTFTPLTEGADHEISI